MIPGKVAIYVKRAPVRIASGAPDFKVRLVLVNGLGHSFAVGNACNGWLVPSLATSKFSSQPGSGLVGCAAHIVAPGTTQILRILGTSYSSCSGDRSQRPSLALPVCTGRHHDTIPPLPPGRYQLAIDTTTIPDALRRDHVRIIVTMAH
jgi:hypothetical protein